MQERMQMEYNRERTGKRVSLIGILLNFLLAGSKIAVGAITGFVSVMADGFNNLTDCGASVVSLVSFKIAAKPADKEHPYGHRRAEYVATMLIAFFVLLLAVELGRESVDRMIAGTLVESGLIIYLVMGISFAVKAGMFLLYRVTAKRISSDTLKAAATDSLCDCISTLAVTVGALLVQYVNIPADGWVGLLVALFIAWQGVLILKETGSKLIGQAPDPALIAGIKARIVAYEGVLGLHDLHVYSYGPRKYFASVHIEVDANVPVLEAHELIDLIERDFAEHTDVMLTGHLDPIVIDDERTNALRAHVAQAVKRQSVEWNIHDFRVVWGEKLSKVIFDVTVPFSCERGNGEVASLIAQEVAAFGSFETVITVERE